MPVVVGHTQHQRVAGDAGVVDQDVQPTERRQRSVHELLGRWRLGDVGLNDRGTPAFALDFLCDRSSGFELGAAVHDHVGAAVGEGKGDSATDTAGCARDERRLACEGVIGGRW